MAIKAKSGAGLRAGAGAGVSAIESAGTEERKPLPSQTLMRGLDIIEAIAEGVSDLSELASRTGMTYSTAHRIVSALQSRHYVIRDPQKGYRLGRKILELGYRAYSQIDLTRLARPLLEHLAQETSDTVHLGYRDGDNIIYLDKIASRRAVEISSRIGGMKPLISTGIGKALLLDADETEWAEIFQRSAHVLHEPSSLDQFLKTMRNYRRNGFSYDLGEDEQTIRCVAAPVRDSSGRIVAALSVSSTLEHMSPHRMRQLAPTVLRTAAAVSKELGQS